MQRAARAIAAAACLACGLLAALASGAASGAPTARAPRIATTASALPTQITFGGGSRRIPTSFFGLSVEYKELRTYVNSGSLFRRMLSIVRPRDGRPMVLRIGGKSADHVWWDTTEKPPQWVTTIGEQWLSRLSGLVSRADLKVVLDLNLAVHSPTMAARFAKAAVQALPGSSVAGFEVGNEPDLYWRQPWLEKQRIASTSSDVPQHWTGNYSPIDYERDYEAYARAVMTAAPGIPLGGPEIISSKADWLTVLSGLGRLEPGFPIDPPVRVVHVLAAELVSLSDDPADARQRLVRRRRQHHRGRGAVRPRESHPAAADRGQLDQLRGQLGRGQLVRDGVVGARRPVRAAQRRRRRRQLAHPALDLERPVQSRPGQARAATGALWPGGVRADDPRSGAAVDTTVSPSAGPDLKAWTVRRGATTNVLLLNKSRRDAEVSVPAAGGGRGAAIVRRLQAPRIGSTTGLRFAGRWIGTDGLWHGQEQDEQVTARGGSYPVTVPGYSAAMLTLGG